MGALEAFSVLSGKLMLGSQIRRSDAAGGYDVIDPATEDRVGQIPDTTEAEVEEAIRIANQAQRKWRKVNANIVSSPSSGSRVSTSSLISSIRKSFSTRSSTAM